MTCQLFGSSTGQGAGSRVDHLDDSGIEARVRIDAGYRGGGEGGRRAGLEPVAAEVEEASVGPVTRGEEEDEKQEAAVDAGSVEEVGADEEEEDEGGRGVGRDEEEREPAGLRC